MNPNALEAMTGIPSGRKKVRRGGGRHQAKAQPTPKEAFQNVKAAMAAGDHASAKTHALHLAKALHAATKPKVSPQSVQLQNGLQNAAQATPTDTE